MASGSSALPGNTFLTLISQTFYAAVTVAAALALLSRRKSLDRLTMLIVAIALTIAVLHVFVEVRDRYHAYLVPLVIALATSWKASLRRPSHQMPPSPSTNCHVIALPGREASIRTYATVIARSGRSVEPAFGASSPGHWRARQLRWPSSTERHTCDIAPALRGRSGCQPLSRPHPPR